MADIPDQTIIGRVEHMMNSHRQFDHAQAGAKVSAGDRDGPNRIVAQFTRKLLQLIDGQVPDVLGIVHAIQQRREAFLFQNTGPRLSPGPWSGDGKFNARSSATGVRF